MSQHDFDLANQAGAAFRADLNTALLALVSGNSGAAEPETKYAGMIWVDTAALKIKQRNQANNAWIVVGDLDQTAWGLLSQLNAQLQAATAFTTGGTATAFTLTPAPVIAANAANLRFRVKFHAAAGATPTLAVNGKAALNLKYRDSSGTKQAITSTQVPSGWIADVECDGTDWVVLDIATASVGAGSLAASSFGVGDVINGRLDYSLAGNALTVRLKTQSGGDPSATDPVHVVFRSNTLTNGGFVVRTVSAALSLTISSGSTLGTTSAQFSSVAVRLIDNAGTVEIAADNLAGGNNLDESTLISTTAEGGAGAADSASVIYSTTARSNVAWRLLGLVESTQTTAGTWAQTPSAIKTVQASGLNSLGYGQTWQDVTGSRALSTTYYNTTGRPILVAISHVPGGGTAFNVTVNGGVVMTIQQPANTLIPAVFVVPPGGSYSTAGPGINGWKELR